MFALRPEGLHFPPSTPSAAKASRRWMLQGPLTHEGWPLCHYISVATSLSIWNAVAGRGVYSISSRL
jgi:hypothetical protein